MIAYEVGNSRLELSKNFLKARLIYCWHGLAGSMEEVRHHLCLKALQRGSHSPVSDFYLSFLETGARIKWAFDLSSFVISCEVVQLSRNELEQGTCL